MEGYVRRMHDRFRSAETGENQTTVTIPLALLSWNRLNKLETVWTKTNIIQVSVLSVLMILTLLGNVLALLGNVTVIIIIASRAELRHKRVNVFILNLAVGDLTVCFVTMATRILRVLFDQWVLGDVACKVINYGQIVTLASTILLMTAMSIDRYQVRSNEITASSYEKQWRIYSSAGTNMKVGAHTSGAKRQKRPIIFQG